MYRSLITALTVSVLGPVVAAAETPPTRPKDQSPPAALVDSHAARASGDPGLESQLQAELQRVWSGPDLRDSTTAVYVVDVNTGQPLFAVHEHEKLNPASNVKLIATAMALEALGPDWRYSTRVLGPQPGQDGTVAGDIYVRGDWDPTLRASHLPVLAAQMYHTGIRRITGAIHVGVGADTAIRGVRSGGGERDSIADPILRIRVMGAVKPGGPPTVTVLPAPGASWLGERAGQLVDVRVEAVTVARTGRRQRIKLQLKSEQVKNSAGEPHWQVVITGQIPTSRRITYHRRAPDGGLFSGQLFALALADAGIHVTGRVQRTPLAEYVTWTNSALPVELVRHESAPLARLVKFINKRSRNRLADQVTMTAGAARFGGPPSMDKGVRAMTEWMRERIGTQAGEVVLDTGSGLSYRTELSVRHIVDTLRAAGGFVSTEPAATPIDGSGASARVASADTPDGQPGGAGLFGEPPDRERLQAAFRKSLAIGGVDGTLKRRFRRSRARRHVIGKTGTLTRVIALAGVVESGEGNTLAFAIVSNGHPHRNRRAVRKQHELMVEAMHRYLRERAAASELANAK